MNRSKPVEKTEDPKPEKPEEIVQGETEEEKSSKEELKSNETEAMKRMKKYLLNKS